MPTKRLPMFMFAFITILPCVLIGAGALLGGGWAWGALIYMTALVASMDRLIAANSDNADPDAEFPASNALLLLLGLVHFAILPLSLWAVAGPSGLEIAERIAVAAGAGLIFGQISHPVAHELIHKRQRLLRWLGMWIYTSLLTGHHASAHLLIHHVYVGSDQDPNSAPKGENFYRYMARVTRQSFVAALRVENARRRRSDAPVYLHPYGLYMGGGVACASVAAVALGPVGLIAFLSIIAHAQIQILMSDYVQHYGLRRIRHENGRLEAVGPQHSWNAPDVFSAVLMVNAPRHSDHHMSPHRAFPALQLNPENMPYLPYPLPVMGVIALFPKLWFRLMNPLCARWQPGSDRIGGAQPVGRQSARNSGGQGGAHLAHSAHAHSTSSFVSSGSELPR